MAELTLYQVLCLIGFPSMFATIVALVRNSMKSQKALMLGLQAVLRDRLLQTYNAAASRGFADFSDRANFENMYAQYHQLGANGVMDDVRAKYLALPMTGGN